MHAVVFVVSMQRDTTAGFRFSVERGKIVPRALMIRSRRLPVSRKIQADLHLQLVNKHSRSKIYSDLWRAKAKKKPTVGIWTDELEIFTASTGGFVAIEHFDKSNNSCSSCSRVPRSAAHGGGSTSAPSAPPVLFLTAGLIIRTFLFSNYQTKSKSSKRLIFFFIHF